MVTTTPAWNVVRRTEPAEPVVVRDGPIHIVMSVDDAYTEPFLVAVRSILDHADGPVRFTIVSIQSEPLWALCARALKLWIADYDVVRPPALNLIYARCRRSLEADIKTSHYLRLWIADLLPSVDRVLYLDCDLIVRRSLTELWNTPLGGAVLGAIDCPSVLHDVDRPFVEAYGGRYFNSGVLLIDLRRWRADHVTTRTLDWVDVYRRAGNAGRWTQYWDQSPLNMALRARWKPLAPMWNFTPATAPHQAAAYGIDRATYDGIARDPAIYHFIGPNKPWVRQGFNAFATEYAALAHRVGATIEGIRDLAIPAPADAHDVRSFATLAFTIVTARLSPVRFIQVGAHDGSNDPIHAFVEGMTWVGLLIEPAPHLFERLRETYAGLPTVRVLNVRIDRQAGCEDKVRLDDIVDRYGIEPDVLVVDTDGDDAAVLDSLTLERYRPVVVYLGVRHLSELEAGRIVRVLKRFGYLIVGDGEHAIAMQPDLLSDATFADALGRLPSGMIR